VSEKSFASCLLPRHWQVHLSATFACIARTHSNAYIDAIPAYGVRLLHVSNRGAVKDWSAAKIGSYRESRQNGVEWAWWSEGVWLMSVISVSGYSWPAVNLPDQTLGRVDTPRYPGRQVGKASARITCGDLPRHQNASGGQVVAANLGATGSPEPQPWKLPPSSTANRSGLEESRYHFHQPDPVGACGRVQENLKR
jgi:hypothetical protein